MKPIVLFLALVALPAAAQSGPVLLRWRVPPDSALAFRTTMRNADPTESADSATVSLMPRVDRAELTTILRPRPDGETDVDLIQGDVAFAESSAADGDSTAAMFRMLRQMQGALGGVQLRARISASGAVTSFWLPQEQKNLVSLFFELPTDSVAVGDEWSLDGVSLLFLRGPFRVDESSRTNTVRLVALEGTPEAPVAMLAYSLREHVAGSFGFMEFGFTGRGAFDVAAGTWQHFAGKMQTSSRVQMGGASMGDGRPSVQDVALEPVRVPED